MNDIISISTRVEHSIKIENFTLYLLIDRVLNDKLHNAFAQLHKHAYAELFVCVKGSITLVVPDRHIIVSEGELLLIPCNYLHRKEYNADPDNKWFSVGLHIVGNRRRVECNIYSEFSELCAGQQPILVSGSREMCESIYQLKFEHHEGNDSLSALLAASILAHVSRSAAPVKNDIRSEDELRCEIKLISYLEFFIDNYYAEDFTAEQLAKQLFISTSQLSRIVKKRFGTTLHRVIIKKRLSVAAKLLIESEMPIDDITRSAGFRTLSCFYRSFREEYGITPIKYRNDNLKII